MLNHQNVLIVGEVGDQVLSNLRGRFQHVNKGEVGLTPSNGHGDIHEEDRLPRRLLATPPPPNLAVSAYSHDMTTLRSRSFHLEGDRPQPYDLFLEPRY